MLCAFPDGIFAAERSAQVAPGSPVFARSLEDSHTAIKAAPMSSDQNNASTGSLPKQGVPTLENTCQISCYPTFWCSVTTSTTCGSSCGTDPTPPPTQKVDLAVQNVFWAINSGNPASDKDPAISTLKLGQDYRCYAIIKNMSNYGISGYTLSIYIDGEFILSKKSTDTLQPGSSWFWYYNWNADRADWHTIEWQFVANNDQNSSNNTKSLRFYVESPKPTNTPTFTPTPTKTPTFTPTPTETLDVDLILSDVFLVEDTGNIPTINDARIDRAKVGQSILCCAFITNEGPSTINEYELILHLDGELLTQKIHSKPLVPQGTFLWYYKRTFDEPGWHTFTWELIAARDRNPSNSKQVFEFYVEEAEPTSTPTTPEATATPPTPTVPAQSGNQLEVYEFDQTSLADIGWGEIPGGFGGASNGAVQFSSLSTNFKTSADYKGMEFHVEPGQVCFVYPVEPIDTGGDPVLLRLHLLAQNPATCVALGALRGSMTTTDGSIATLIPASMQSYCEEEKRLVLMYQPDQGTIFTPIIQVSANANLSGSAIVWVDRLEVIKLDPQTFGKDCQLEITSTPTSTPTNLPEPTPTSTRTPTPRPTSTYTPVPVIPTPGPAVNLSGTWIGSYQIQSHGYSMGGYMIIEVKQSGESLTVTSTNGLSLSGTLRNNQINLTGTETDGDPASITGTYSDGTIACSDNAGSNTGTMTISRPGVTAQIGGIWSTSYQVIYPANETTVGPISVTYVQRGNDLTIRMPNASGRTNEYSGKIFGDIFIVSGWNGNQKLEITGKVTGKAIAGYIESSQFDEWWWGKFQSTR